MAKETDTKAPAEAKEPTVKYYSPAQVRRLVRKARYDDGTADLHCPDTGELIVGRAALTSEPRTGFYSLE